MSATLDSSGAMRVSFLSATTDSSGGQGEFSGCNHRIFWMTGMLFLECHTRNFSKFFLSVTLDNAAGKGGRLTGATLAFCGGQVVCFLSATLDSSEGEGGSFPGATLDFSGGEGCRFLCARLDFWRTGWPYSECHPRSFWMTGRQILECQPQLFWMISWWCLVFHPRIFWRTERPFLECQALLFWKTS
jgi:hypothetical protein